MERVESSNKQIKTYKDLLIWEKSIAIVTQIYRLTSGFPKSEMFGLSEQLRRAAVSIPSNIAEGYGRKSQPEFARFCQIAMGSLFEVQTQLTIAHNLGFIDDKAYSAILDDSHELERMLSSFIAAIRKHIS